MTQRVVSQPSRQIDDILSAGEDGVFVAGLKDLVKELSFNSSSKEWIDAIKREDLLRAVVQNVQQHSVSEFMYLMQLWSRIGNYPFLLSNLQDGFEKSLYNAGAVSLLSEVISSHLEAPEIAQVRVILLDIDIPGWVPCAGHAGN